MREGSITEARLWRGSQTVLIAGLMWMVDQNFTSKAQFSDYRESHQLWSETTLGHLNDKLDALRRGQEAIELEIRTMNRKVRDATLVK